MLGRHWKTTIKNEDRDTWVAPSVGHLTLDSGSGHDLTVLSWQRGAWVGLTHSLSLFLSLSPPSLPLSLPLPCMLSLFLSLKINI